MSESHPWRDKERLREKYWGEGLSLSEVGEKFDCSRTTVAKWMDKHGMDRRDGPGDENARYRDKETLHRLYWDKGLSTIQIADKLNCGKQTVQKWMKKHGIERRKSNHEKTPNYLTKQDGYEYWQVGVDYDVHWIPVHRLVALSEGKISVDEFRDSTFNVHHDNGVRWDNRPTNLEVLTHAEHAKLHSKERDRGSNGDFL